jgi:hypothetical protein
MTQVIHADEIPAKSIRYDTSMTVVSVMKVGKMIPAAPRSIKMTPLIVAYLLNVVMRPLLRFISGESLLFHMVAPYAVIWHLVVLRV